MRIEAAQAGRVRIVGWYEPDDPALPLHERPNLRAAITALRDAGGRRLLVDARATLGRPLARMALEELLAAKRGEGRGWSIVYCEEAADDAPAELRAGVREAALALRVSRSTHRPSVCDLGQAPYGFRSRGKREADAYQQAVLGRIATLRAEGLGARRIAARLRELGFKGPDGRPIVWSLVQSQIDRGAVQRVASRRSK